MKNKKLFAILTLLCFMFTLMPVAAFAANDDAYVVLSAGDKKDRESLTVTTETPVTVGVKEADADTDTSFVFVVDEAGDLYTTATTDSALKIKDAGTYNVYAMDADDANDINGKLVMKADKLEAYLESDSLVEDYAVLKVKTSGDAYVITIEDEDGNVLKTNDDDEYITGVDANGDYGAKTLVAKVVTAGSGSAVKGAELDFSDNGVDVTEVSSVTDRKGEFEFTVSGTTVGTFEVEVAYEDVEAVIVVSVGNVGPADVEVAAEPTAPVDVDTKLTAAGIGFKLVDANGNVIKGTHGEESAVIAGEYKVTVAEEPADSDLNDLKDEDALKLVWDKDNGYWELDGAALEEEGEYTFKVALENGASAKASVTVQEFDEAVELQLVYKTSNVALGGTAEVRSIKLVDANGVTQDITGKIGDSKLELAANGAAVESFEKGVVVAKDNDRYLDSVITVVAVYDDKLTATAQIYVVEDAVELALVDADVEAGVTNTLKWDVVNSAGKVVSLGVTELTNAKAIVLDKPENAYASAGNVILNGNGNRVTMDLTVSTAGEYEVQVYGTYKEGEVTRYVSGVATITVGAKAAVDDIVVMSIGATKFVVNNDVKEIPTAPIIENGRTMVPLRALVEAFGAEVAWDEATQSVTVVLDGTTVVMTIGSANYTVNGEPKTADVVPFINADNYTMVPVRFVAQAFGITPTPIADETGAVVDVMFAK